MKKVEIFKGLRTIQKSQWQDGEGLPKEENWDELNSKVQDFLQQRRLSKKVNIQECKISYSYLIFYILRMLTVKTRKEGRDRVNSVTFSHIVYVSLKSNIVIVCSVLSLQCLDSLTPDQAPLNIPESSPGWPGPRLCC